MADAALQPGQLEAIFKKFDVDGDGKISADELGNALKGHGSVTPDEIKRMMNAIDTDGDGSISYLEFTTFANANVALLKNFV